MIEKILNKLLSGRFILTVIGGAVFAILSIRGLMPKEAVVAILSTIFVSYFNRGDRKNGGNQ